MVKLLYLNIGCGSTFHSDWENVDFISTGKGVKAHNLLKGIPYPDQHFEVVYHSHVLEHFLKPDAERLIQECYRILKPGGIIRIAVPDLEPIARNYIQYLEEALNNVEGASEKYNWTMLEMYDQAVRTASGGEMIGYIKDSTKNNDAFLLERNGHETKLLIENLRNPKELAHNLGRPGFIFKVKRKLTNWLLGEDIKALNIGQFRLGGEVHQWMYDRYSLAGLLQRYNFKNATVCEFNKSAIPNWNTFGLDEADGKARKPDSLFMEAMK